MSDRRPEKPVDGYAMQLDNLASLMGTNKVIQLDTLASLMGTNKVIRETTGTIVADSISAALLGYADHLRDPVAAVREAVESGTIEGEVVSPHIAEGDGPYTPNLHLDPGTYLVIRVSDRGEDR